MQAQEMGQLEGDFGSLADTIIDWHWKEGQIAPEREEWGTIYLAILNSKRLWDIWGDTEPVSARQLPFRQVLVCIRNENPETLMRKKFLKNVIEKSDTQTKVRASLFWVVLPSYCAPVTDISKLKPFQWNLSCLMSSWWTAGCSEAQSNSFSVSWPWHGSQGTLHIQWSLTVLSRTQGAQSSAITQLRQSLWATWLGKVLRQVPWCSHV